MAVDRDRLRAGLARCVEQVARLESDHAGLLAAAESSNSDDEHDPDGATLAFEREQLAALLARARRTESDLRAALGRLDRGDYGICEACGGVIGSERLDALPDTRTCIDCARDRRRR